MIATPDPCLAFIILLLVPEIHRDRMVFFSRIDAGQFLTIRGAFDMMVRCVWTLFAGLLVAVPVRGQVPAKPLTDALGDPLPPGAVARLGTLRWKHPAGPNLTNANLPWPVEIFAAKFSADGKKIVSVEAMAGTVRVWDAGTGKEVPGPWTQMVHAERLLALSPDGRLLAVHGAAKRLADKALVIWDLAEGKLVQSLARDDKDIHAAQFSSDGKSLVTSQGNTLTWWDVSTGKMQRSWQPPVEDLKPADEGGKKIAVRFYLYVSPGGRYAVAAVWHVDSEDQAVAGNEVFFDLANGKVLWRTPVVPVKALRGFVFSQNNERLMFLGTEKLQLCEATTGKVMAEQAWDAQCPRDGIHALALSADGTAVAVAAKNSRVFVWRVKDTSWRPFSCRITQPTGHSSIRSLAFAPDGKTLLVPANADLQLYDVATLKERFPCDGHRDWVDYVAFSADGKRLLTGSAQRNLHPQELATWEVGTWKQLSLLSARKPIRPNIGTVSAEHTVYVGSKGNDRFNLYDFASGKLLGRLQVLDREIPKEDPNEQESGFFAPGGKFYVLTGKYRGKPVPRLYEVPSGKMLFRLPSFNLPSTAAIHPLAFSADGRLVALYAMNSVIYILETATGQEVQRLGEEPGPEYYDFHELAFSPDGRFLASWNDFDHAIRLWNLKTSKVVLRIDDKKKDGTVHFAWSPDGRLLAVGTSKIQVWEMASLKVRHEFTGHQSEIRSLAFSPDSRLLASGSTDTTVLIWDMTGSAMAGQQKLSPNLVK
jgi:WD40 repeat protein